MIRSGRECTIYEVGEGGPLILWGVFDHREGETEQTIAALKAAAGDLPFVLATWEIRDWNRELSPWPSGEDFAGDGEETLHFLEEDYLPYLKGQYGDRPVILMGYSLAGLFSLWAMYVSDRFDGAICGSGSVWFPGWDTFTEARGVKRECFVYLSLGGKEEKTRNPIMATVGDRMRAQERLLKADPRVKRVTLEWNPGGHFADVGKRLGKGLIWFLR